MLTLWAVFWNVGSRTRGVVDEEAVDAVGDGPVGSRHEVAVGVHGDADGAVAESGLDRSGVGVCINCQADRCVAEFVEPKSVKACSVSRRRPVAAKER